MYYEIIYETGEHSVACYQDDEEAARALSEHHRRAMNGEKFQTRDPQDTPAGPATRIKRVIKYSEHPVDLTESGVINTNTASSLVSKLSQGDLVSVHELTAALRDEINSTISGGPHSSNYKASGTELSPEVWE